MVGLGLATPGNLLLFTFLIGAAGALTVPAWQAVVTQLVPKEDLPPAIAANSVGVNIVAPSARRSAARSSPPWALPRRSGSTPCPISASSAPCCGGGESDIAHALPAERFGRRMTAGLRYARHNPHLRATLVRAVGFFLFASAYWALLPLVARTQIAGGPGFYGVLLGVIGAGAVSGAFLLPWLKARLGPDRLMAVGRARPGDGDGALRHCPRAARSRLWRARSPARHGSPSLATLSVSAQVALPDWVRGRGLALVHDGVLRLPDARQRGLGRGRGAASDCRRRIFSPLPAPSLAIPLTWRWKLQTGAGHRPDAVDALAGADHSP